MPRAALLVLLVLAATPVAGWLGWRLGRRGGSTLGSDGGHPAPPRPEALDDAWRAKVQGRRDLLQSALGRLMAEPPEDDQAAEEMQFLLSSSGADLDGITSLAEGRRAHAPAVVAAAQRLLAREHPDPAVRRLWAERFAREFPRSWALPLRDEGPR